MRHDTGASALMSGSWYRTTFLAVACLLLAAGCERKQRAREREALQAAAKAKLDAKRLATQTAAPLPEEPPVEITRVPDSGLPCDVDDVFARKCRRCHTIPTRHGAPFVFLTWQDAQQIRADQPLSALIGRAVRSGFMPYRIEANPPVQPLTEEEKKIILDWVDAGAPRQDCDPSGKSTTAAKAKPTNRSAATPKPSASPRAR
jgi:uncharacterized membrane protein